MAKEGWKIRGIHTYVSDITLACALAAIVSPLAFLSSSSVRIAPSIHNLFWFSSSRCFRRLCTTLAHHTFVGHEVYLCCSTLLSIYIPVL